MAQASAPWAICLGHGSSVVPGATSQPWTAAEYEPPSSRSHARQPAHTVHLITAVPLELYAMVLLALNPFKMTPTEHGQRADMTANGINTRVSACRRWTYHPAVTDTRLSLRRADWRQ